MTSHEVPVYIEGVSTDVVVLVVSLVIAAATIFFYAQWRSRRRPTAVHPDSEQQVADIRQQRREAPHLEARTATRAEDTCAVCLEALQLACETNCGHVFCGTCLVSYWRHGTWLGAIQCPACRTRVTILLECFTHDEVQANSEELRQVHSDVSDYNRRFSGAPRSWRDLLQDTPTLLRHAVRELFTAQGILLMFRLRFVFLLVCLVIYILSPFDILSEAALGLFGYIDDFLIILLFMLYVTVFYRAYVQRRAET